MFCKNCGKEIDDHAYVCVYCGVKTAEEPQPVVIATKKKRNNVAFGLGITGFVLSILSLYLAVFYCITSIVAIVLSTVSMYIARKNGDNHGLAIAGLVIGIVTTALWMIILISAFSWVYPFL